MRVNDPVPRAVRDDGCGAWAPIAQLGSLPEGVHLSRGAEQPVAVTVLVGTHPDYRAGLDPLVRERAVKLGAIVSENAAIGPHLPVAAVGVSDRLDYWGSRLGSQGRCWSTA